MGKSQKSLAAAQMQGIQVLQSNRITNAKYNYSLLQERVFNWIMFHNQVYIREVMNGKRVHQLDLFAQQSDTYLIDIPMNYITKPEHYNDIREVCEKMITIPVVMLDDERKTRRVAGLISSVQTDFENRERINKIRIEMRSDVIRLLLHVDRNNNNNKPQQYTQYLLQVAMQARNKYTAKMYKLLCSWRERGGFKMKLRDLRELLQIPEGKYKNFNDFKRFVLLPVQRELKDKADLWFNVADSEFNIYEAGSKKKVEGINFKIIEPMSDEMLSKKIDHVFWTLKNTFGCAQSHCEKIRAILTKDTDWHLLGTCLDRCYIYGQENTVKYMPAFVVRSILNELSPS